MSCCPADAYGKLDQVDNYQPKGVLETEGDLPLYRVGSGEKCIIWNYDIFGLNAGRTKLLADLFSSFGYMVIIPDFYRNGDGRSPTDPDVVDFIKSKTKWTDGLEKDILNCVLPYAKKHGATRFGAVGTCWGSYVVLRLCAMPDFFAGVSWHPSHTPICGLIGEDVKQLVSDVNCDQLFMLADGDAKEDMSGGQAKQILGDKLKVVECLDMKHGWTTRGDMSDENIKRDVHLAISEGKEHFKKFL